MEGGLALTLIQLTINGLAVGCLYGLVALGFALVYKSTEIVNFAQGDLLMLGAFFAWTFIEVLGLPYIPALLLTALVCAVAGVLLERGFLRPITGYPQFAGILLTIGLAFMLRGGASMLWGPETRSFPTPFTHQTTSVGGLVLSDVSLSIIAGTLVLTVLLFVFFRFTRIGIAMQAASQNQLAAYLVAIPVKRVNALVWGISAGVAGVTAVLLAPITLVDTNLWMVILKAFAASVLGGFGSIPGALVGGLLLGVVEQFAGVYFWEELKDIVAYLVLLGVLIVWPRGLFAQFQGKKV